MPSLIHYLHSHQSVIHQSGLKQNTSHTQYGLDAIIIEQFPGELLVSLIYKIEYIQLNMKLTNPAIGQRSLIINLLVHLNPNFNESGLLQQQSRGVILVHLLTKSCMSISSNFYGNELCLFQTKALLLLCLFISRKCSLLQASLYHELNHILIYKSQPVPSRL